MQIYDISVPISRDLPCFPGDPPTSVDPVSRLGRGDAANVAHLSLSTHAGTHIDAPRHFMENGTAVDGLPLSLLVGEALVVDMRGVREIGRPELAAVALEGVERLLLKTDNSALWERDGFCGDYSALTEDGAAYLLQQGVRLVGIDYLSIEAFTGDGTVHRLLLGSGGIILEGLDLSEIAAGRYELVCLPLKVRGGDGAPARAILRRHGAGGTSGFDPHTSRWPLS
jgi:arylformamidase